MNWPMACAQEGAPKAKYALTPMLPPKMLGICCLLIFVFLALYDVLDRRDQVEAQTSAVEAIVGFGQR